MAQQLGNPPQLWLTYATMGDLLALQDRPVDAQACYGKAIEMIERVADGLEDVALSETFLDSEAITAIMVKGRT